jgi:hypothetical protein
VGGLKFQKHSDGRTKENLGCVEVELWAKKRMGMQKTFFFRMECRKLQPARLTKVEYTTGVRMVFSCALAPKISKL